MFPASSTRPRVLVPALAFVLLAVLIPGARASSAPDVAAEEVAFVAELNEERATRGLDPMVIDASMTVTARDWADAMADGGFLRHANDITTGAPDDWLKVGENVGRGASVDQIVDAFMASPGHAANVLEPSYNRVGVGVAMGSDGRIYTTHRFAATAVTPRTCRGRAVTIVAEPGIETIGTPGDDVIVGTAGDDVISGRGGDDVICGRGGDDVISGGPGDDLIDGDRGDDEIRGQAGDDTVLGGPGNDSMRGGGGFDRLAGHRGADSVFGGTGRDSCRLSGRDDARSCVAE